MISHIKRGKNEEVEITTYCIYDVLTKIDRHHLYHKELGTKKQRSHSIKDNRDKIWEYYKKTKSKRKHSRNQIGVSLHGNLERLSTNWTENFAEERNPSISSFSSHWPSTSSWSLWSSNWQGWHQSSWKDCKWIEYWWTTTSTRTRNEVVPCLKKLGQCRLHKKPVRSCYREENGKIWQSSWFFFVAFHVQSDSPH